MTGTNEEFRVYSKDNLCHIRTKHFWLAFLIAKIHRALGKNVKIRAYLVLLLIGVILPSCGRAPEYLETYRGIDVWSEYDCPWASSKLPEMRIGIDRVLDYLSVLEAPRASLHFFGPAMQWVACPSETNHSLMGCYHARDKEIFVACDHLGQPVVGMDIRIVAAHELIRHWIYIRDGVVPFTQDDPLFTEIVLD